MTIDEYAEDTGALDDNSGPTMDPMEQSMIDHLVEFETEMFRLKCRRRISMCDYRQLERLMVNLHGEYWKDALQSLQQDT